MEREDLEDALRSFFVPFLYITACCPEDVNFEWRRKYHYCSKFEGYSTHYNTVPVNIPLPEKLDSGNLAVMLHRFSREWANKKMI